MPAAEASERTWGSAGLRFDPLDRDASADVVVVGAGFIGLTAALDLAAAGRKVIVLDARGLDASASAISAGHVGPMLYGARKGPNDIVKVLGETRGRRLNERAAAAGRDLFDVIEEHRIDCAARRGYVGVYRSARSLEKASTRFDAWSGFGGRSRRLSAAEVRGHIASDRYAGGFLIEDGGWVDPLRLIEGLARAATAAGAVIHTGTAASSADREGAGWRVGTVAGGSIASRDVVVATGAVTPDFAGPDIAGSVIRLPCAVAASVPDRARFERLLPAGGPVADFDDPAVFAPVIDDRGRLVVSALQSGPDQTGARAIAPARRRLVKVFGEDVAFPTVDRGTIPVTLDGLPNLIRRDDGLIAVTGCNGFGLTLGMIAAREAARLVLGTAPGELALPVKPPKAISGGHMVSSLLRNLVIPLGNRFGA